MSDTNKNSNTLLAELLNLKSETDALVEENAKGLFEATVKNTMANILTEIEEAIAEDEEMDNMEGDTDFEVVDVDMDNTGEDAENAEDNEESELADEMPNNDEEDSLDSEENYEVVDLTDASFEELTAALKDAPDGVVRIVKKPTYDVSFKEGDDLDESNMEEGQMDETSMAEGDKMDESTQMDETSMKEGEQMDEETNMEEGQMDETSMEEGEQMDEETNMEEGQMNKSENMSEMDKMDEACSDDKVYERKLDESKVRNFIIESKKQLVLLENKVRMLESQLEDKDAEIQTLNETKTKYVETLTEAKTMINNLALTNTKMGHIAKLFVEFATTNEEKKTITESFDNDVTTINESKLAYKMWAQKLGETVRKNEKPLSSKVKIVENKENKKDTGKKVIKEEKTHTMFDRIVNYQL